jgi:hypothetical protein
MSCLFSCLFSAAYQSREAQVILFFVANLWVSPLLTVILRYIEGRKCADAVFSVISITYLLGSGIQKMISLWLLDAGVSGDLLPAIMSVVALLCYALLALPLDWCPDPTEEDIREKNKKLPISWHLRIVFLKSWGPGIFLLSSAYAMSRALRNVEDLFESDIFANLNLTPDPSVYFLLDAISTAGHLIVYVLFLLFFAGTPGSILRFLRMITLALFANLIVLGFTIGFSGSLQTGFSGMIFYCGSSLGTSFMRMLVGTCMYEALMSAAKLDYTSNFAIFFSDFYAYLLTLIMIYTLPDGEFISRIVQLSYAISISTSMFCAAAFL